MRDAPIGVLLSCQMSLISSRASAELVTRSQHVRNRLSGRCWTSPTRADSRQGESHHSPDSALGVAQHGARWRRQASSPTPLARFDYETGAAKFKRHKSDVVFYDTSEAICVPSFSHLSQLEILRFGLTMQGTSNQFCVAMIKKPSSVHQSSVTRVLKGAVAGGFRVTSVKVDKDGSIVLFSHSQECEEPCLPTDLNEWDEVLKK